MKKNKGFTLIELMIVIAIIAILMSYAIPAYRNYTVRAKAGEGVALSSNLKMIVSEAWVSSEPLASMNSGTGLIPAAADVVGRYVSQISVTAGVIEVTYNNADPVLNGNTLTLEPTAPPGGGSLQWRCSSSLNDEYIPPECRTP
ncbi:pilin [Marinicella sp. W31]|uniref:pilin n=1 Tax=Marinicella sp. W31 TaxID=3023713 RepID=UPI0037574D1F